MSAGCKDGGLCLLEGWDDHVEDFKRWADTTDTIHNVIKEMHTDTRHLAVLPNVVDRLHDIVEETRLLRESLVAPATNRNFLPMTATIPVILAMVFCMSILGGLLLVHMSDDRNVKLAPHHIEITK